MSSDMASTSDSTTSGDAPGSGYDSTGETLRHSLRVGALLVQAITELLTRAVSHDVSKTREPELGVFNRFTPKLRELRYGSDEYWEALDAMGDGLRHHYEHNRHHPEHFAHGVNDMTLIDVMEMLADWKAATERVADGDLAASLAVQQERFSLAPQLVSILRNTAQALGWLGESITQPA